MVREGRAKSKRDCTLDLDRHDAQRQDRSRALPESRIQRFRRARARSRLGPCGSARGTRLARLRAMSKRLSRTELLERALAPLDELCAEACALRDEGHGALVSYSRKVFIPLTRLCRDVCAYCTFAKPPRRGEECYLTRDEVVAIARAGAAAGCAEALFTLGDKPELRYRQAREELAALGHATTISYLAEMCRAVLDETGLLPHANPGVMDADEIALLRSVSVSQGLMLESASPRLCQRGEVHFGSPDKYPAVRLQ